jgi:hypothetical protein
MVNDNSFTGYPCVSILKCAHPPYSTMSEMWQHLKKAKGNWRQPPDMEAYQEQPQNQGVAGKVQIH